MQPCYDQIGRTYRDTRGQDPRIAELIHRALGDARSVLNVGAGTGSYEPTGRDVLAVEPSETMIRQRPPRAAPAIRALAEQLPLPAKSFDAALAVNTVHHWRDVRAGLRELRRVTRYRIVIFHRDAREGVALWLTEEYFPSLLSDRKMADIAGAIEDELGPLERVPIPLAANCEDGLFSGYWARPELYLKAEIRRNISNFALADEKVVMQGLEALRADLESGAWDRKHGHLRTQPEIDLGHRLLIATLA
jgi:SAM-dependent methyltransferase